MESSKKILLSTIFIAVLVVIASGITFAFFNYTRTGLANNIQVGRIYFNTLQTETINLTNIFPIASNEATGENSNYDEVVIEIEGDATYDNGVEYLLKSVDVSNPLNDKDLPVTLSITVDGIGNEDNDYFTNRNTANSSIYQVLTDGRLVDNNELLVGYIAKGATGIDGSITIKAYIDKDRIAISDTYDSNNFEVSINKNITNEAIINCVNFFEEQGWDEYLIDDETLENFCNGTGTNGNHSLQDYIDNGWFIYYPDFESSLIGFGILNKTFLGTEPNWVNGRTVFTTTEWNSLQTNGISFKVKVEANEGIWVDNPYVLYNIVKKSAVMDNINSTFVDNVTPGIDFTNISGNTNGKGVYLLSSSKDDSNPIYYYRGNIDNNNVYFGGFCWKMIRTTENGGIKMIYNGENTGTINDIKCESTNDDTTIRVIDGNSTINYSGFSADNYYDEYAHSVGYMHGDAYPHDTNYTTNAYYGNSFNYDNNEYQLVDPVVGKDDYHHYSCASTDPLAKCQTLYYYYSASNYRLKLTNGDGVEEAIASMNENNDDSRIKYLIDTWYAANLTSYTNKLDDAIYCNDRRMITEKKENESNVLNSWFADGGAVSTSSLYYLSYDRLANTKQPTLTCQKNDAFTVTETSTGNGALDYPIALISADEIILAGGKYGDPNEGYYLKTGSTYWTMTPYYYSAFNGARSVQVWSAGLMMYTNTSSSVGIRPVIALKHDIQISGGKGTVSSPYIVE